MPEADLDAIVSGAQIRGARKLLGWSFATLAKKARRPLRPIADIKSGDLSAELAPVRDAIHRALGSAGIELADG